MPDPEKNVIPPWALEPLSQFLESIGTTHDFYHLTIDGLRSIIHHHKILVMGDERIRDLRSKVSDIGGKLNETEEHQTEEKRRAHARERAKERADLAQREVSNEFPILHSQQVVSLWSSIECFVEDVLVTWLANDSEFRKNERVQRIKIPIVEFDKMNESERRYFLVSELQRDPGFSQRNEIEKFESLLALAGLSGEIDAGVKRDLIELGHMRNVLLHRRGIADAKFVQACPWLKMQIGERVKVNAVAVERYSLATVSYYKLMLTRMKTRFEIKVNSARGPA